MQTKDFKGQDLRGRSFKSQDLTGADFSDCDLRGVDFSFANLTDAKFCNARIGITLKNSFILLLFQTLLSTIAGFLVTIAMFYFGVMSTSILKAVKIKSDTNQAICIITYALLFDVLLFSSIFQHRWRYAIWLWGFMTIGAIVGLRGNDAFNINVGIVAVTIGAISTMAVIAGSNTIATVSAIIVAIGVTKMSLKNNILFGFMNTAIAASVVGGMSYIISGLYLGWRANKREESQLSILRSWSLKVACWHSTEFAFANLNQTNFSYVDLKFVRFKNAKFNNCNFQQSKNHHLALTENTPLEPRKVRDLVIDGIITDKNFATLDLRGLDFSNLNLENFDFSYANLSGTNLSHTQLTGATLEGWNIDTETRLDNIDCRYYYYLENGAKKRMPPEGEEYCAGEFTRIFQKIANTIDFIAHNEMELAAIKLSVEQVRVESGNDDIRVQAIEEKDGFIVVKVTVPKTEDRGILYHEVNSLKQDYETKIQILMTENHAKLGGLQGNIEILKEQIREQRQALLTAIQPQNLIQIEHHQGEIIMGDKTISTNITGSTINGSVVTAETVENSFNSQSSESQHELKELVEQLKNLINTSTLPEATKQKALSKTQDIAEATKQPKEEQQSIVQKTLGYFDGLADSLDNIPETAQKLAKTAAGIASLFGLSL